MIAAEDLGAFTVSFEAFARWKDFEAAFSVLEDLSPVSIAVSVRSLEGSHNAGSTQITFT